MCNVCLMMADFDPIRHPGGPENFSSGAYPYAAAFDSPAEALALADNLAMLSLLGKTNVIEETIEAPYSADTPYELTPSDAFVGRIVSDRDVDIVKVSLTEGNGYNISAVGEGGFTSIAGVEIGPLIDIAVSSGIEVPIGFDTDLRLYDPQGNLVMEDAYSGAGVDAKLTYTAEMTGDYYVEISSGNSFLATGDYVLDISESVPLAEDREVATIDELATFLKSGLFGGIETKFDLAPSKEITVDISGLTEEGQYLARAAMETWEMVADLHFIVQDDGQQGNEDVTFDDEDIGAFALLGGQFSTVGPLLDFRTVGVELNVNKELVDRSGDSLDTYSFQTYIHEIGHILGLNHMGDYNGGSASTFDFEGQRTFLNDSTNVSVMSYIPPEKNPDVDYSNGYVMTAMMADIVAIQDFFGAPDENSATAGDTTYGEGSNLGNYMDLIFSSLATATSSDKYSGENPIAFTIYDHSGVDTVDFGFLNSSNSARIDLNDGTYSDIGEMKGVMAIAIGTEIENVVVGRGDDVVTGNEADNIIDLGEGNDLALGGAGNDTLIGGAGADILIGGADADTFIAGAGDLVDGGSEGNDQDLLDLRGQGLVQIIDQRGDSDGNGFDGTVIFVDENGNEIDERLSFENIERIEADFYEGEIDLGNPGGDPVMPVDVNERPEAIADKIDLTAGQPVVFDVLANDSDPDGDTLTLVGGVPPKNGVISDNGDGTYTYTPNPGFYGQDTATYEVSDGNGNTDTASITFDVAQSPDFEAFDDVVELVDGEAVLFDPLGNDNDPTGGGLTIRAETLPEHGQITENTDDEFALEDLVLGTGNPKFIYTPDEGFVGTDSLTYSILDSEGNVDTATITFVVTENRGPVAEDDVVNVDPNDSVFFDPLENDVDPDGGILSIKDGILPENGTIIENDINSLTYIPDEGFVGRDTFTYAVVDAGGDVDIATVTFNVGVPEEAETDGFENIGYAQALQALDPVTGLPVVAIAEDGEILEEEEPEDMFDLI